MHVVTHQASFNLSPQVSRGESAFEVMWTAETSATKHYWTAPNELLSRHSEGTLLQDEKSSFS